MKIFFLATADHLYTIKNFLGGWGKDLSRTIIPCSYEMLLQQQAIPLGVYIFADLERLSPRMAEAAAQLWQTIVVENRQRGLPVKLLNHPTRSLRRFELLRTLYEKGINQFTVYRLTEAREPQRFPVFIRNENDHEGSLTPLIQDRQGYLEAVQEFQQQNIDLREKIVTEFIDTVDQNGIYRKYSAIVIDQTIIARDIQFSRHWVVKQRELVEQPFLEEQKTYIDRHPHLDQLRRVAQIANITYGRFDYSLIDDQIQVWEINTNPFTIRKRDSSFPLQLQLDQRIAEQVIAAYRALIDPSLQETLNSSNP
jgi:hypothetical protein